MVPVEPTDISQTSFRRFRSRSGLALLLTATFVLSGVAPALAAPPEKTIVSNNAFLRSNRVEVGARPNASFGSNVNAPAGWNPRNADNGSDGIGFRYLRSGTWATGVTDGDFFLPGGPYEGWGVEVIGGSGFKSNSDYTNQISGAFTLGAGPTEVVWTSSAPVDGISIEQRYSVPTDGTPRLRMDVLFTNTTGGALDVVYMRGVDADNCIEPGIADPTGPCSEDGYDTTNLIASQRLNGDARSAVAAIGADGSVLVLWSEAPQSLAYFDSRFCAVDINPNNILNEGLAERFSTVAEPFDDGRCGPRFVTAVGQQEKADTTIGLVAKVSVPGNGSASLVAYYELSGAEFGLGAPPEDTGSSNDGDGVSGPSWIAATDGGIPTLPFGSGLLQNSDGSRQDLLLTDLGGNRLRYSGDGLQVTFTGGPGSGPRGLIADENGQVECEICAFLAGGGVIEAWMFSEPRLVAAWRVEDLPCQRFTIPVGAPLDGGGPIPAGAHTLQLVLPTASGLQAVNVGVSVGSLRPVSVRAGEGPTGPIRLDATMLLGALSLLTVQRLRSRQQA